MAGSQEARKRGCNIRGEQGAYHLELCGPVGFNLNRMGSHQMTDHVNKVIHGMFSKILLADLLGMDIWR